MVHSCTNQAQTDQGPRWVNESLEADKSTIVSIPLNIEGPERMGASCLQSSTLTSRRSARLLEKLLAISSHSSGSMLLKGVNTTP